VPRIDCGAAVAGPADDVGLDAEVFAECGCAALDEGQAAGDAH
jgi:hypothetical protein